MYDLSDMLKDHISSVATRCWQLSWLPPAEKGSGVPANARQKQSGRMIDAKKIVVDFWI